MYSVLEGTGQEAIEKYLKEESRY